MGIFEDDHRFTNDIPFKKIDNQVLTFENPVHEIEKLSSFSTKIRVARLRVFEKNETSTAFLQFEDVLMRCLYVRRITIIVCFGLFTLSLELEEAEKELEVLNNLYIKVLKHKVLCTHVTKNTKFGITRF